jgi:predicted kinase
MIYVVIYDFRDLNSTEVEYWKRTAETFNYDLEIKNFFTPLQECIDRDSKRPNPIGEKVIRNTYERYKDILEA